MEQRSAEIMRTSAVSIASNIVLAAFKGIVGIVTHSIAITLDAIESLTDAVTSVVTIAGTKLAQRPASRAHPFGFGRMEYITAIVIAALIIATGTTLLIESVQTILNPREADYGALSLTIVAFTCAGKVFLGLYLMRRGRHLEAETLSAAGRDTIMDAFVSAATIVAALVYLFAKVSIEAWLAAVISLLIIKDGVELLIDMVSKMLGERVDSKVPSAIEKAASSVDGVKLASGVVVQDYGPNRLNASLYLTVDGHTSVADFDGIARIVQQRVAEECGVQLTCIGAYPTNTTEPDARAARSAIGAIVWAHDHVVELRGLYVDQQRQLARFDAVADYGERDLEKLRATLVESCEAALPGWSFEVRVLPDIGD